MQEMPQQKSAVEEERNSKVNFPFLVKAVLRSICPVGCFRAFRELNSDGGSGNFLSQLRSH